jgi:hypothetical protein
MKCECASNFLAGPRNQQFNGLQRCKPFAFLPLKHRGSLNYQGIAKCSLTLEALPRIRQDFDEAAQRTANWEAQLAPSRSSWMGERR